jgi:hypothetical protein
VKSEALTKDRLDINDLKCLSLAREALPNFKVASLTGWASGIDILRVPDVLYLPEYPFPVCAGFVPEEAINYDLHLDVRLAGCRT